MANISQSIEKMSAMYKFIFGANSETIMSEPDALKEANIGVALYFKPGYALGLLRNQILALKDLIMLSVHTSTRWAYKHPTPWDFFRTIENAAGEDLGLVLERNVY